MDERRKWKRYPVAYPVERVKEYATETLTLRDVSKGGVAVITSDEVRENETVDIQIFLKSRMFRLEGVVVHAGRSKDDKYTLGIRFSEPPDDFQEAFEREIEEMTQFHRECNLYEHKGMTFKSASAEYLKDIPPSE